MRAGQATARLVSAPRGPTCLTALDLHLQVKDYPALMGSDVDTDRRAVGVIGQGRGLFDLLLVTGGVLAVALAGYVGFRWSGRLDLGGEAGAGLMALAVVTGFAAFFSPCSFPLLVGLLTGQTRVSVAGRSTREGVRSAMAMGAGAAAFLVGVGALVGLVGQGITGVIGLTTPTGRALRGVVAAVIGTAGLVQLGVLYVPLGRFARLAQPIQRARTVVSARHRRAGDVLYGFGFLLAGFG